MVVKREKKVIEFVVCPLTDPPEPVAVSTCRTCSFYEEDDRAYVYCKYQFVAKSSGVEEVDER